MLEFRTARWWIGVTALYLAAALRPSTAHGTAHILVAGGLNALGTPIAATYYAPLLASGDVGAWTSSSAMPAPRKELGLAQVGSYVFAVGGATDNTVASEVSSVYSAQIFAGGGVFPWATTTNYPMQIYQPSLFVTGGTLYSTGGDLAVSMVSACYYATAAGGTLSGWTPTSMLPDGRGEQGGAQLDGYFYVLGGRMAAGLNATNTLFQNQGTGGGLPGWGSSVVLPFNVVQPGFAATNGYLYQVAGNISGGGMLQISASYAVPAAGGSVGSWSSVTPLPIQLAEHAMVAYGSYLYVLGGTNVMGNFVSTVYVAPVNGIAVGPWRQTTPLPLQLSEHAAVVVDLSTPTPSGTPTATRTPTASSTSTRTRTETSTATESATPSDTWTPSESPTVTQTVPDSATATGTATATTTASTTATPTNSVTATRTATSTRTHTVTVTGSPTDTATSTATLTDTDTRTETRTATISFSATSTGTPTIPSNTPTPRATSTAPPGCRPDLTPTFLYVDRNTFVLGAEIVPICWALPEDTQAHVRIFNGAGEYIATVFDGPCAAGIAYARTWDGRNESGSIVAAGVYVVRLDAPDYHVARLVAATHGP